MGTKGKSKVNPRYTHFVVSKASNKILNAWDYKGYDPADLNADKAWYFFNDMKDWEIDRKTVRILTAKFLIRQGINPFDWNNWTNNVN